MLRLSEHYVSAQGEGPRTGALTQFVRFASCNMRCPGWPCDTQHAIDPAIWRVDSEKVNAFELYGRIVKEQAPNICLTGGEPFIQPLPELKELCDMLIVEGFTIECFSNGSVVYPDWALENIAFIMDWKLPGSGEATSFVANRIENALALRRKDCIKFVAKDEADLIVARNTFHELMLRGCKAQFWVGAVWGTIGSDEIVEFIKTQDLNWKLNVQVHKFIWHPEERKV